MAATDLEVCLSTRFKEHRHIIFLAHSNGGIVVKRFLRDWYALSTTQLDRILASPEGAFNPEVAAHTPWGRTRGVVNFDVPHHGGAYYLTTLAGAWSAVAWLPAWVAQKVRDLRVSLFDADVEPRVFGHNQIFLDLFPLNPFGHALYRAHLEQLAEMGRRRYPRPAVYNILATINGVIREPMRRHRLTERQDGDGRYCLEDQYGQIYRKMNGNHTTVSRWRGVLPAGYQQGAVQALLAPSPKVVADDFQAGGLFEGLRDWKSIAAAAATLRRLLCDRQTRVDRAVGDPPVPDPSARTGPVVGRVPSGPDTQAGLLVDIRRRVDEGEARVQVIGPPGVGKSTVVRLLAREYCGEYLAGWFERSRRLPLFIQLRDPAFNLRQALKGAPLPVAPPACHRGEEWVARRRGQRLLLLVAGAWCAQANGLVFPAPEVDRRGQAVAFAGERYTIGWLARRLRHRNLRTLVVVDSVDEFLANNSPHITLNDISLAFRALTAWLSEAPGVAVVATTRIAIHPGDSSNPQTYLAPVLLGGGLTRPLRPMSEADCRGAFPAVAAVLGGVPDEVRKMLLTPLFARLFERSRPEEVQDQLTSRSATFSTALRELYAHSGLLADGPDPSSAPEPDHWTAALAILVRVMYAGFLTSVPAPPELAGTATPTLPQPTDPRFWNPFRPRTRPAGSPPPAVSAGAFWESVGEGAPDRLRGGAALLREPALRAKLLQQTILRLVINDTGERRYAVYHNEFSDFLLAWYFAACIRAGQFTDFADRALNSHIFTAAGELLVEARASVDGELLIELARTSRSRRVPDGEDPWRARNEPAARSWLIFGNVGATVGNSALQLAGGAPALLLSAMRPDSADPDGDIVPSIRLTMIGSWSRRVLRRDEGDVGARMLFRVLADPASPDGLWRAYVTNPAVDRVTRSTAWCCLREFADHPLDDPHPAPLLPDMPADARLEATRAVVDEAADLLDSAQGRPRLTRLQYRSMEVGWGLTIGSIRFADGQGPPVIDEHRSIQAVHYLLVLTALVVRGAFQDPDLPQVVAQSLDGNSALAQRMRERTDRNPADEVARVYGLCRDVYHGRVAPAAGSPDPRPDEPPT